MTDRVDNFNRSNTSSPPGAASDGLGSWTVQRGTLGINGNQLYNSAGDDGAATLESSVSAAKVGLTNAVKAGGGGNSSVIVRAADNLNKFICYIGSTDGIASIVKMQAGAQTELSSASVTHANGDQWEVAVTAANDFDMKQNGTSVVTANSSFGSGNTAHGCGIYHDTSARIDDFYITEIIPDTIMPQACL